MISAANLPPDPTCGGNKKAFFLSGLGVLATIAISFLKERREKKEAVETTNIKTGGNGGNLTTSTCLVPVSLTHQLPSGNNNYEPLQASH